ncbi:non-specific lipid-transfer protein 2-like [Tripterygium wilfordii]|uniref:Non-specific lipid-transfer protein 2-like n=1 Tax=Tripterygium wilfordii TaxID=458696 RepID=A0A7J7CUD2_TRIWF|nr:non-specific lipid-transfer protein 2-like [Tripterygium wilfordii]KAF5737735.1 non-specific lipid-transfer protein 2-like [Tripterygium wilfordii]
MKKQEVSNVATLFVAMMFVVEVVPMSRPITPMPQPLKSPLAPPPQTMPPTGQVCNPLSMSDCGGAILFGGPPTKRCCIELNSQGKCLCEYLRDPTLKQYINNPNSKRISTECGVATPVC